MPGMPAVLRKATRGVVSVFQSDIVAVKFSEKVVVYSRR